MSEKTGFKTNVPDHLWNSNETWGFEENLFIYFWLCWVFSLVAGGGGYSSFQLAGFLLQSMGSRVCELQELIHTGSVVVASGLLSAGSVAVVHGLICSAACAIFLDRDHISVSCIGRRILYHWATREALKVELLLTVLKKKCLFVNGNGSKCLTKII